MVTLPALVATVFAWNTVPGTKVYRVYYQTQTCLGLTPDCKPKDYLVWNEIYVGGTKFQFTSALPLQRMCVRVQSYSPVVSALSESQCRTFPLPPSNLHTTPAK